MKWEEHYQVINNRYPYIDLVTKSKAYAYGDKKNCYILDVSKRYPYDTDRQDWEQVEWNEFPKWVRDRCEEVEPILLLMKPTGV